MPGDKAFVHGVCLASAQKGDMAPFPRGPTTNRKSHRGPVLCGTDGSQRQEPWWSDPWLDIGTWNVTSLVDLEPQLVQAIERYQQDIVGLTSR